MRRNNFIKETYEDVKSFGDIVDGNTYVVNYNGTEFMSKLYKEGDYFTCTDEEHGMRLKFKEANMNLGHISLKEVKSGR